MCIRDRLASLFAEKAHLALNDGTMFGKPGEGFMRLNVGCPRSAVSYTHLDVYKRQEYHQPAESGERLPETRHGKTAEAPARLRPRILCHGERVHHPSPVSYTHLR